MTQAALPCDLILLLRISTSWSPVELQISTWLDLVFWRYGRFKISTFWLENAYSGLFLAVFGDFDPYNCDVVVLTPKEMQLSQKHAFWGITRQNWSSGLVPRCAKEQIKKHRPLIFHPFLGSRPEPIDMPFGVLSGVPDVITHAKFYLKRLRGFSAAARRIWSFPIPCWTTLTTVLHYVPTVKSVMALSSLAERHCWVGLHYYDNDISLSQGHCCVDCWIMYNYKRTYDIHVYRVGQKNWTIF